MGVSYEICGQFYIGEIIADNDKCEKIYKTIKELCNVSMWCFDEDEITKYLGYDDVDVEKSLIELITKIMKIPEVRMYGKIIFNYTDYYDASSVVVFSIDPDNDRQMIKRVNNESDIIVCDLT